MPAGRGLNLEISSCLIIFPSSGGEIVSNPPSGQAAMAAMSCEWAPSASWCQPNQRPTITV
jgi:hypothetical protein